MTTEPKGPYSVKQADGEWVVRGPSFRGGHLICGDDEEAKEEAADWCFELNKAYAEGRASRDGLREAAEAVMIAMDIKKHKAPRGFFDMTNVALEALDKALAEDDKTK
jgi:hypothetical protein